MSACCRTRSLRELQHLHQRCTAPHCHGRALHLPAQAWQRAKSSKSRRHSHWLRGDPAGELVLKWRGAAWLLVALLFQFSSISISISISSHHLLPSVSSARRSLSSCRHTNTTSFGAPSPAPLPVYSESIGSWNSLHWMEFLHAPLLDDYSCCWASRSFCELCATDLRLCQLGLRSS